MTTISIATTSDMAGTLLSRVELIRGEWYSYGRDGRETVRPQDLGDGMDIEPSGRGWRARFIDSDGDYGWGPIARTAKDAIILFLAEYIEIILED